MPYVIVLLNRTDDLVLIFETFKSLGDHFFILTSISRYFTGFFFHIDQDNEIMLSVIEELYVLIKEECNIKLWIVWFNSVK